MASKSAKSDLPVKDYPNDQTYLLLPWHHGEATRSWWLNKDRASFSEAAKVEAPRIKASAMAVRISKRDISEPR